ncbi:mucolipin-2 isoform X4 [Tachysurus fulvidraco]|uniref:mucolipin-2 isoform X4 n=1 Tax=Tachysurus fulvidraco TaxID=1234273 RepID=UPI001FEE0084|nr:mucolipin-2 isoform X4 [Tachysurus fulvidraco]
MIGQHLCVLKCIGLGMMVSHSAVLSVVLAWSMELFAMSNVDPIGNPMSMSLDQTMEESLRDDLRYYFMSPCEKYRARRQLPWKLTVQILKIVMITTQLILFGLNNQLVVAYKEENLMAFKNLFLKSYSGVDEDDYSLAVYTKQSVFDHLYFIIDQYSQLDELSVGSVSYAEEDGKICPLVICKEHYKRGSAKHSEKTYDINAQTESAQKNTHYLLIFDAVVILVCLISSVLCIRSIFLAIRLLQRFSKFCVWKYNHKVCEADQREFLNGWYILVIISDVMAIIGSILKMEIQAKSLTSYDVCSIFLGTSTLMVWVGVIRYLGYFQKYNVLILTMQAALPNVLRFCCCAGMIYLGYTFCGWIVLGPYHEKFEGLSRVAECLFSLVNGDDMFPTFAEFQQKNTVVWLFSRVYLYSFISLFIYMVLSLFIALITDAYESIKRYQKNGFPMTELQLFLSVKKEFPEGEDVENGEKRSPNSFSSYTMLCGCRRVSTDDCSVLIS